LVPEHPALVLEKGQQNNVPLMMSATKEDGGFAYLMMLQGYIVPNNLTNRASWMRDELVPTVFKGIGMKLFLWFNFLLPNFLLRFW
jgi:hypothetical protein